MTDFVSQLEQELLAAAHRRASSRRRLPRLPLRPILVVATLAAALVAVLALAARPAPTPAPPTKPPAAGFTLPVAERAEPCEAGGPEVTKEPAPRAVFDAIALFGTRGVGERLAVGMRGEWTRPFGTWLALGAYAPGSERQPLDTAKLHVVPTADVRSGPIACGPTQSRGPGACLVFGTPGEPVFTRCFTLAEIEAGRAFTLVDVTGKGARLLGLVPDGVGQVGFATRGISARLRVRENVVQDYIGGLKAASSVTVKLDARKPIVLMLNETTVAGLASAAAQEMHKLGLEAYADTSQPATRSETVVQVTRPGAEPLARRVAGLLGGRVESSATPPPDTPFAPDVVVRLGTDRMR